MRMMKDNQVFSSTLQQIRSTTEVLKTAGFITYENPSEKTKKKKEQRVTWKSFVHGREVSSKAFLTIDQYLKILTSNSYQILLFDYSIIRYSFVFDGARLIRQNLLWWPCPVKMDNDIENEFENIGMAIKDMVNIANNQSNYIMRSPIRIDYDSDNNKADHPRAHMHLSHPECRINTNAPICFNRFIRFIIYNFYPKYSRYCKEMTFLPYKYGNRVVDTVYSNPTRIIFN